MLNTIKEIIKDKSNFLEAAAIIFEDGSGQNLDDVIVLGEEKETDPGIDGDIQENDHHDEPSKDDDDDEKEGKEPKDSDDEGEGSEGENKLPEDDDVGNLTIDDEPAEGTSPVEAPMGGDDILDSDIGDPDQPMPLPGSDLPTPIGAQTGEPINPMDDILNVEIDLGSNTVKDVLPVPPANANEALTDGNDTQHVDSGFGGDSGGSGDLGVTESTKEESVNDVNALCSKLNKQIVAEFKTLLDKNVTMNKLTDVCEKIISDISKSKNITFTDGDNFCVSVTGNIDFQHGVISKAISNDDKISGAIKGIIKEVTKNVNGTIKDEKYKLEIDEEHGDSIAVYFPKNQFDISKIKESLSNGKKSDGENGSKDKDHSSTNDYKKESSNSFWESFFYTPKDSFSEAITMGDEPAVPATDDATVADPVSAEAPVETENPDGGAESEVTSAVRDKVSEAETDDTAENGKDAKEELLKKLGSITKNLEDAKKAVMSAIQ